MVVPVRQLVQLYGLHGSNIVNEVVVKPEPHLLHFVPKWLRLDRRHYRRKLWVGLRPFIKKRRS